MFEVIGALIITMLVFMSLIYWYIRNPAFAIISFCVIVFTIIFITFGAQWGLYNEQEALMDLQNNAWMFQLIPFACVVWFVFSAVYKMFKEDKEVKQ